MQEILRRVHESAGLTQAALASRLGKPQSFVAKYETGEQWLVIELIRALKVTKHPLHDLIVEIDELIKEAQILN